LGGWGGVFDAPARSRRGVEDSAPVTQARHFTNRAVIPCLFLRTDFPRAHLNALPQEREGAWFMHAVKTLLAFPRNEN